MKLNEQPLTALLSLIDQGTITPHEIAVDLIDAIDSRDGDVNAYLEVFEDELLNTSKQLSTKSPDALPPLFGIPIAIKDNIGIAGKQLTCASRILDGNTSPYSATVVEQLYSAGALFSGRTNMDEFAMGSSTESSAMGPTRNPWNTAYSPGGSSGGSAAAVATGTAIAALGSDTGGSIRQPASFCGVVGMKPSYGRVSRYGLVAYASSLDQVGPITRNVQDCAAMMSVICGDDPRDGTDSDRPVPDFSSSLERGLEGLTIGVPREYLDQELDLDVIENFKGFMQQLVDNKVTLVDVAFPYLSYAVACYYIMATAEASSNLARYDGITYGKRPSGFSDISTLYRGTRKEGFGEEVVRRILLGTYVLSAGYHDDYYLKAQKVRSLIIRDFTEAFSTCDLIMMPTSPTPPFKLGEKIDDPLVMYLSDVFTIPANLAGLPAISVPCGLSSERLPLGIQLIGKPFDEETVLRGAYGIEELAEFKETPFD